jgi:RNAse (barnase) inhibitor barstar
MMSALSNMPLQAVLPLSAYDLDDLKRSAERSDQTWLYADCSTAKDKKAVLTTIAKGFSLPKHFGMNLDGLYDCLTDLQANPDADSPGIVVVLESIPESPLFNSEERDGLLDVFRDASDFFSERKIAFRIFYSVHKISKH